MEYVENAKKNVKDVIKKAEEDGKAISDRVQKFLYVIANHTRSGKSESDAQIEMIKDLFKAGFVISDPTGTKKVTSTLLHQVFWRVMSKMKFLDYQVHGTGRDEVAERITKEGIATVANRGGLMRNWTDKGGVAMEMLLFGDGYLHFGQGQEKNPVKFKVIKKQDIYLDNHSLGLQSIRPATKAVAVCSYDKDEARDLWPELKENDVWGRIPGTFEGGVDNEEVDENEIVEIGYGYNRATKCFSIFAGNQAFEVDYYEKEEYPFVLHDEAYIPIFQFLCIPSIDEPTNYGLGHLFYRFAVLTQRLINLQLGHVEENTHPLTLINGPQGKVDELIMKMAEAYKARAADKLPYVAVEHGAGGNKVVAQSLLTQSLYNEWQALWNTLAREFARMGVNIDDLDRGSGITRGQVIAEEEAGNAFVKQIGEYNAEVTEKLIECTMQAITEFVKVDNKTPLNLMTRIKTPDGNFGRVGNITMGMLSKELKEGNYFVMVNRRSGALTSDLMRTIQQERLMAMTPPGSPEWKELYRRSAYQSGVDMELGEGSVPAGAAGPGIPQDELNGPIPGGAALSSPAGMQQQPETALAA